MQEFRLGILTIQLPSKVRGAVGQKRLQFGTIFCPLKIQEKKKTTKTTKAGEALVGSP